jgi:hypothetical protein
MADTCSYCGRPFQRDSRLVVKADRSAPPPQAEPVEWQLCSFECLKLHAEELQERTLDIEWALLRGHSRGAGAGLHAQSRR